MSTRKMSLLVCSLMNPLINLCGKYTCHHSNGTRIIDYTLVDNITLTQLRYFKVEDLIGNLSDHCIIS